MSSSSDLGARLGNGDQLGGLVRIAVDDLVEYDVAVVDFHWNLVDRDRELVVVRRRLTECDEPVDLADELVRRHRALVDVVVGMHLEPAVLLEALRPAPLSCDENDRHSRQHALLALLEHAERGLLRRLFDREDDQGRRSAVASVSA